MEREERETGGERKGGGLMVEKLKRGILVGKRVGNSTPSPTWKFGIIQPDGTLIPDFNISADPNTLSARKLGANLWEMEAQFNLRLPKTSRKEHIFSSSKQEMSGVNSRMQLAASLAHHNARVEKDGQAQQPLSPTSYSSSTEMAPHRSVISPNSSLFSPHATFGESSHGLKTSTELLKVLNRIWSLEEKHALDMSLVKTLRKELDQSEAHIQELMKEKKRDQNEIDNLMKYKRRHHKLGKEVSEIKSSFSKALTELERERKARILLEDLCDEFAKGVRDYEQEVRFLKQKSGKDRIESEGNDRVILHISEAWLDERAQLKLDDVSDKQSALDKLCLEIESFLREKGNPVKNQESESFHLNEPASAPWKAKDEDESVGVTNHCPQLCRGCSLRQGQEGEIEIASGGHGKETTRSRTGKDRVTDGGLEEKVGHHRYISVEGSFDPSTFTGPPGPVKKWTSEVSADGPDISESSSRWPKSLKPNTLKAKLMEARLEGQQSRMRTSRSLSHVD